LIAPVKIYLIRHAQAVDEGPGLVDESRYLSEKGRAVALAVGETLAKAGVELDTMLTSPLVRAVQTAELIARGIAFTGAVRVLASLAPGFSPQVTAERAAALGQSIALIGHEPQVSALGALLVARPSFPQFRAGQVALIERGQPMWKLNPETLTLEQLLVD
jgi:phosphohistidine phosphatase